MTLSKSEPTAARTIDRLLAEYGESHRDAVNKAIHWLCVPVIFWCVLALLSELPFPAALTGVVRYGWAQVAAVLATLYYLTLSLPLTIGMALFTSACLGLVGWARSGPLPVWELALAAFVVAWIGQFVGHAIEGRKPSFFKDLQFLLIGPAWLMAHVFRRLGVRY